MVLSEKEKVGAVSILNLLSKDEILSLANTVTKSQIVITSLDEAIKAIIAYTENPVELLRRRKVRRDVLFKYTYQEKIAAKPTDEKFTLIQRILAHWGSHAITSSDLVEDDDNVAAIGSPPPRQILERVNDQQQPSVSQQSFGQLSTDNSNHPPDQQRDFNCWNDSSLNGTAEDQEMAVQFAHWYYPRLNGLNNTPTDFGPEHFFSDAVLYLLVASSNACQSVDRFVGSELVVRRLSAFVTEEKLIFNANDSRDGVRGFSDPHGRRVIIVCGTIHRGDTVLGLFEQQFGLVRDPTVGNNWKIRSSRLAVTTSAPTQTPTLTMTQAMLTSA